MTNHSSEEKQISEDKIANVFSEVVEIVENSGIEDLETLFMPRTPHKDAASMVRTLARRAAVQYIMRGEEPPPHVQAAARMMHLEDRLRKREIHGSLPGCKSRQWRRSARITARQGTYQSVRIAIRKDIAISRPVPAT